MNAFIIGIFTGALGLGYFIYGKRQAKFVPMIAGILLCVYPYFTDRLGWLIAIGVPLAATPFVIRE